MISVGIDVSKGKESMFQKEKAWFVSLNRTKTMSANLLNCFTAKKIWSC